MAVQSRYRLTQKTSPFYLPRVISYPKTMMFDHLLGDSVPSQLT